MCSGICPARSRKLFTGWLLLTGVSYTRFACQLLALCCYLKSQFRHAGRISMFGLAIVRGLTVSYGRWPNGDRAGTIESRRSSTWRGYFSRPVLVPDSSGSAADSGPSTPPIILFPQKWGSSTSCLFVRVAAVPEWFIVIKRRERRRIAALLGRPRQASGLSPRQTGDSQPRHATSHKTRGSQQYHITPKQRLPAIPRHAKTAASSHATSH